MKFRNALDTFSGLLVLLLLHFFYALNAVVYSKCTLARELRKIGVPRNQIADWTCIAKYESSYNARAINYNIDYSKDWGIFQINDRFWCKPFQERETQNKCNVSCYDLLDDIPKAMSCAQRVLNTPKGFGNWAAWRMRCNGKHFSVSKCLSY